MTILRRSARRRFALVLTLVVAAVGLGCRDRKPAPQSSAAAATTPKSGGTAVLAISEDLVSVNEVLAGGTILSSDVAQRLLFLRLFEEQPDYQQHPPTFGPRLAESYEWSADHLTLTVHLRHGVLWSDGEPVTAADVRFTWQAQTDPNIAWDSAYLKEAIRDVEVVDASTARLHFARAYFSQLGDANEGVILPKHAWEKLPFAKWRDNADWFRQNLVVDGPFTVASWTPRQEIVFARNPKYFEPGLPRLDRVVLRVVPDQGGVLEQLLAGQLDYVQQITPAQIARVQQSPRARLIDYPNRQYTFVCWNSRRPQFADADVRRALTLGIDRQRLIDTLWRGYARTSSSPIIGGIWAHDDSLAPLPYDPEQARALLTAKGWIDHDGDGIRERHGRPLRFELLTNTGNSLRADAAVMIQEQLKRIGVDAQPRQLELNTMLENAGKHDFDAMIQGFAIDTSLDLSYAFTTQAIKDGNNWTSYSNPEVDRLVTDVRAQTDPVRVKAMLVRVQQILYRDQPVTFLWEPRRLDVVSARLRDVEPNAVSPWFNIRSWWVQD